MKTIRSGAAGVLAGFALWVLTAAGALAAPITVPTSLNPGDQYRLAFVTSQIFSPPDITFANFIADQIGDSVISSDWKAIASTSAIDARDNTNTNFFLDQGLPIYQLDGSRLAANYGEFWLSSLNNPFVITEFGTPVSPVDIGFDLVRVWTGTGSGGVEAEGFDGADATFGIINGPFFTQSWLDHDAGTIDLEGRYYAISGVLTVPNTVPQVSGPAPLGLMALGLAGLAFARRTRPRYRS